MSVVNIKQLLEAGVHFGHQTHRWNPKMNPYIFGERNGIHIVDLQKTAKGLDRAVAFVREQSEKGSMVLFVGTKKQARGPVSEAAKMAGMPFVTERWLGGMLTNFETVRKSIDKVHRIEKMEAEGEFRYITKKEVASLLKEKTRIEKVLSGIREMKQVPDIVFIIDPKKEAIGLHEAKVLGLKVVALVDTNTDPNPIDYPIPGNDDAIRAVKLISETIARAVIDGRKVYLERRAEEEARLAAEQLRLEAERAAREEERKAREEAAKVAAAEGAETSDEDVVAADDSVDDENTVGKVEKIVRQKPKKNIIKSI